MAFKLASQLSFSAGQLKQSTAVGTIIALAALTGPSGAQAVLINSSFNGNGDGVSWSDDTNWNPIGSPNNGTNTFDVTIGGSHSVTLNVTRTIDGLEVGDSASLGFTNGQDLTIASGGTVTNNNAINMNSTGSSTDLNIQGGGTLNGDGLLTMSNNSQNRILTNNTVMTHGANHTIQGSGQILANNGGMINEGTIIADGSVAMTIDPNALGFVNQGTMQATGSGGFLFSAGDFTNTGQTIDIQNGSKLDLSSNVTLNGGTLQTTGSGVVNVNGSGLGLTLNNVTIEGNAVQDNGEDSNITGSFTNNGLWNLNSTGSSTDMTFTGGVTLDGTGTVRMSNSIQNRIQTNNTVMTHAAGHTIQGSGQILANTGGMINEGTIIADQTVGMIIDPNGMGFVNQGTMQATGSGGFLFLGGSYTNTGQTIDIQNGSKLDLSSNVTLNGGTLQTTGSGVVNVNGSGLGLTLNNVTIEGNAVQDNGEDSNITGNFTNNGLWNLNSTGSSTDMTFTGGVTLDGTGTVRMSNSIQNRIQTNNTVMTHAAGHTIQGSGQILANTGGMINEGTIIADQTVGMIIDPNGMGFVNQGTMQATGSGGFLFLGGSYTNTGQTIDIQNGSKLDLSSNVTLNGGTLQTAGSGVVNVNGSGLGLTLNNVTIEGNAVQDNGEDSNITGILINNGVWNLNSTGSSTDMTFTGGATLDGTGTVRMSNSIQNRILTNNTVMTHAAGHTIQGSGQILANTGGMINEGTIIADQTVGMIIDPNGMGFDNRGSVQVLGSGGLSFTGTYEQSAGITQVDSTMTVSQNVNINGGRLTGNGTVRVQGGNGTVTVTTGGTLAAGSSPGTLMIDGDFVQTSTGMTEVELFGFTMGVDYDFFDITGMSTLAGSLEIIMNTTLASALNIGDEFEIMTAADGISGLYDALSINFTGFAFDQEVRGNSLFLVATQLGTVPADVPEPATLTLMGLPLAGLWAARRRHQRQRKLAA